MPTLLDMARSKKPTPGDGGEAKRPTGGKHKTPRTPLQMPKDWVVIARKIAAIKKQPTTWALIAIIEQEARALGIEDLPSLPWAAE